MKPTIAALGASGGCVGWALATALKDGHSCRALARNPEKLTKSLLDKGVSNELLNRNLVIVKGNAKDKNDVKSLLHISDYKLVDKVLFGVGSSAKLQFALNFVKFDDSKVCGSSMSALITALEEIARNDAANPKPQVTAISTTGISSGPRDVTLLFYPLYHWLLAVPHEDKRHMESLLRQATRQNSPKQTGISAGTIVRPSLLTDGEGESNGIMVGTEATPSVGYTISRKDVGLWIYQNLLKEADTKWKGETITLTR